MLFSCMYLVIVAKVKGKGALSCLKISVHYMDKGKVGSYKKEKGQLMKKMLVSK